MTKRFLRTVASFMVILMSLSLLSAPAAAVKAAPRVLHEDVAVNQGISDFVTRLYDICLDRTPDPTGFKTWTEQLSNGENTGVGCAYGFIFSNEFQNKNVSNDQYIELMYNCFFGRASDPDGKANWLNAMNSGMTREELFLGFANSVEFFNLCKTYGITAGCHVLEKDYQKVAKINLFVERLYNIILSRPCDQAGMIDWSTRLANKEISGAQAAYGFIFSDEYRNKNRSDSDFLEDLYIAFMGRQSDPVGKAYWQDQMGRGKTDRDIFNGFMGSQEFIAICNDYGIDKGGDITNGMTSARANVTPAVSITPTATSTPESTATPTPTAFVTDFSNPYYLPPANCIAQIWEYDGFVDYNVPEGQSDMVYKEFLFDLDVSTREINDVALEWFFERGFVPTHYAGCGFLYDDGTIRNFSDGTGGYIGAWLSEDGMTKIFRDGFTMPVTWNDTDAYLDYFPFC